MKAFFLFQIFEYMERLLGKLITVLLYVLSMLKMFTQEILQQLLMPRYSEVSATDNADISFEVWLGEAHDGILVKPGVTRRDLERGSNHPLVIARSLARQFDERRRGMHGSDEQCARASCSWT